MSAPTRLPFRKSGKKPPLSRNHHQSIHFLLLVLLPSIATEEEHTASLQISLAVNMSSLFSTSSGDDLATSTESIDCSDDWTRHPFSSSNSLHKGMEELEEMFRCDSCRELLCIPVSLPCNNSFCNHCLQKNIQKNIQRIFFTPGPRSALR